MAVLADLTDPMVGHPDDPQSTGGVGRGGHADILPGRTLAELLWRGPSLVVEPGAVHFPDARKRVQSNSWSAKLTLRVST